MATLTEMVAALVVQSSAAALSHFGVVLDVAAVEPTPAVEQRTVARSPRKLAAEPMVKASACPDAPRVRVIKT